MAIDSAVIPSSVNSPLVVVPKVAMPASSSILQIAARSCLTDRNTMANVGLYPSDMLCSNAVLISAGEVPLIDFAFMLNYFRFIQMNLFKLINGLISSYQCFAFYLLDF